ncbi:MAG: J domain-containing protein [Spirochaetales bacterium]|nr:J domain-containing protein [Spirochaetales bacterium]
MTIVKENEIQKACTLLFGDSFSFERETIEYLQLSGIKHAFRSKVKECHPDTASEARNPAESDSFLRLKDAYDFLISVKSNNAVEIKVSSEQHHQEFRQQPETPSRKLPNRKLRLGEYLYYSGKINWEELISALTWQRQNRKKTNKNLLFGSYFIQFNIMNSTEMGFAIFKLNVHNANY